MATVVTEVGVAEPAAPEPEKVSNYYFEIFLARMVMCRKAGDFLGCAFEIVINGARIL